MPALESSSSKFPLKELLVPALMLFGVAAYWWDAAGLSVEALAFPAALTGVLFVCLLGVMYSILRSSKRPAEEKLAADDDAPVVDRWVSAKRLAVVAMPFVLILFLDFLGGLVVLFAYLLTLLYLLGERRKTVLAVLPVGLAFAGIALFKFVLYARIPDGLVPLGSIF